MFHAIGHTGAGDVAAWGAAIVAALCFSCVDTIFTAAVLATVEQDPLLGRARPFGTDGGADDARGRAPLGVITLTLARQSLFAPLLLVPLVVAVMLNSRHAAAQRDEHLRFERLYEASARTAHVVGLDDALHLLAAEANGLGDRVGSDLLHHRRRRRLDRRRGRRHGMARVPHRRKRSGSCCASSRDNDGREVILGIVDTGAEPRRSRRRERRRRARVARAGRAGRDRRPARRTARHRRGAHGCRRSARSRTTRRSTTANARLYAELESALARQIDLNRQKGDFVAAVSHELRTPLAVMLAATHTLRKLADRIPEAKRLELLDTSIEQGGRLQRLIDELLLVAAAEHEEADVGDCTTERRAARRRDRARDATHDRRPAAACSMHRTGRARARPTRRGCARSC